MSIDAPKPIEMQAIDYADHTVEIDTRTFAIRNLTPNVCIDVRESADDAESAVDDLTATQVNELLTSWPKKK